MPGISAAYPLTSPEVSARVSANAIGVYMLTRAESGIFYVHYVGRSDDDLRRRLLQWVGGEYRGFQFEYHETVQAAFEKECSLYHEFAGPQGRLGNSSHPQRPFGDPWPCPVPGCTQLPVSEGQAATTCLRPRALDREGEEPWYVGPGPGAPRSAPVGRTHATPG